MEHRINLTEIIKLSRQVYKSRPILANLVIVNNGMYWTNATYLVYFGKAVTAPKMLNLISLEVKDSVDGYPKLDNLIGNNFIPVDMEERIYKGEVWYVDPKTNVGIDQEQIKLIKRLSNNYTVDWTTDLFARGTTLKLYLGDHDKFETPYILISPKRLPTSEKQS